MTNEKQNPYASPSAAPEVGEYVESGEYVLRPKSPKVFGIIAIIFGGLGLLGTVLNVAMMSQSPQQEQVMSQMGYSSSYVTFSYIYGAIMTLFLIWIGVSLIQYRNRGRVGFNVYAWLTIVGTILNSAYITYIFSRNANFEGPILIGVLIGTLVSAGIGLIYPVLGLIFLNREQVKASLK